jgi:hypothetical protein
MKSIHLFLVILTLTLASVHAAATIQTFDDKAAFLAATRATSATGMLPDLGLVPTTGVTVGSVTFEATRFFISTAGITGVVNNDWTLRLPGPDLAISDGVNNSPTEDLDIVLAGPVFAAGFDIVEPENDPNLFAPFVDSTFTVTLKSGGLPVGVFTFSPVNDVAAFMGVWSNISFDRLEIRETVGGQENEFFGQMYTGATALLSCVDPPLAGPPKARKKVSVREFGAVPNNDCDDTDPMQAAADYLCAHPGTTLIYPPGIYNVDKTVDFDTEFSGLVNDKAITYNHCSNVKITGVGAKIEVKGNFEKAVARLIPDFPPPPLCHGAGWPPIFSPCAAVGEADTFQRVPFAFVESNNFVLSGFEIDGNVDQMTQSNPTVYLAERSEYGVWIIDSHDFVLERLFIHHMATDGINFPSSPGSDNGKINNVISANNARMALTIAGPVRNLKVVDTQLRDSGVVGTALNSYTAHSPARGVDIETECLPADADWGVPDLRTQGCRITGNILFNRVRATGSIGGQIAFPHGESSANITVRNSFLQNPIGGGGDVINMGVAGGVVEDSILDAQMGFADPCTTAGDVAQLTSPVFTAYLAELANDPAKVAKSIYRETRGFSSTLRRNTILGQNSLIVCQDALPFLTIDGNTFKGAQSATLPGNSFYAAFGYMWAVGGAQCVSGGRNWAQDVQIVRNKFMIPNSAPRKDEGVIVYCGAMEHFQGNTYQTDVGNAADPIKIRYDHMGTAVNDCFPTEGSIIPIHGPLRPGDPPDYPAFQPYTLSPKGCLNFP